MADRLPIRFDITKDLAERIQSEAGKLSMPASELIEDLLWIGIANVEQIVGPTPQFTKGQVVSVVRCDGSEVCQQVIERVTQQFVFLANGNKHRRIDGHWVGRFGTHPFPKIQSVCGKAIP